MDFAYEQNLHQEGFNLIAGLDEAGRGPLAGPVVAAAVVFDFDKIPDELTTLRDSKKLTAAKRAELFQAITQLAAGFGIGSCDHQTIDRINILQATFLAMKKALGNLRLHPDIIILDGNQALPNYSSPQRQIIKGDNLIFSIAAASVLAKVTRDRLITEMHALYPQYGFDQHKGYGTAAHMDALQKYGPCPIHRRSFQPVKNIYCHARPA